MWRMYFSTQRYLPHNFAINPQIPSDTILQLTHRFKALFKMLEQSNANPWAPAVLLLQQKGTRRQENRQIHFSENSNLSMGPFRIGLVSSSLLIVHTYNRTPIILNTNDIVWVGIGTVWDVATAIVQGSNFKLSPSFGHPGS